jgi:glucosylceramidase
MPLRIFVKIATGCLLLILQSCSEKNSANHEVNFWLTKTDQSALLQKQTTVLSFGKVSNPYPTIRVDTSQSMQTIDGFGFTLTGGSAFVINQMNSTAKTALLKELFGTGPVAIGISYLRLSIGSSDLNASVFSYDDVPNGQTDPTLSRFSLAADTADLVPLLKQILAINPSIKIIAAPWSAPAWMKDNQLSAGGSLLPANYNVYAQYFVRYIRQMQAFGIAIDAVTPQNEPLNPNNNPSMVMTAVQEADFIKNSLGPAFHSAGLNTKIIVYDHNCDQPGYPEAILADTRAAAFVNGSAFHLYGGDISLLTLLHQAHPDKQLYFTEQYTASTGIFGDELDWHIRNVIIGAMRNWSRNALEWNLANDSSFGPHTNGGCTTCKGALTVTGSSISRNVGYYIIAHASKFVPAGSVRIGSNIIGSLQNAAFKTASGKKVLIVENDGKSEASFNILFNDSWVTPVLPAGAVATFVW